MAKVGDRRAAEGREGAGRPGARARQAMARSSPRPKPRTPRSPPASRRRGWSRGKTCPPAGRPRHEVDGAERRPSKTTPAKKTTAKTTTANEDRRDEDAREEDPREEDPREEDTIQALLYGSVAARRCATDPACVREGERCSGIGLLDRRGPRRGRGGQLRSSTWCGGILGFLIVSVVVAVTMGLLLSRAPGPAHEHRPSVPRHRAGRAAGGVRFRVGWPGWRRPRCSSRPTCSRSGRWRRSGSGMGDVFLVYWIENVVVWACGIVRTATAEGPGRARSRSRPTASPVTMSIGAVLRPPLRHLHRWSTACSRSSWPRWSGSTGGLGQVLLLSLRDHGEPPVLARGELVRPRRAARWSARRRPCSRRTPGCSSCTSGSSSPSASPSTGPNTTDHGGARSTAVALLCALKTLVDLRLPRLSQHRAAPGSSARVTVCTARLPSE